MGRFAEVPELHLPLLPPHLACVVLLSRIVPTYSLSLIQLQEALFETQPTLALRHPQFFPSFLPLSMCRLRKVVPRSSCGRLQCSDITR